VSLFNIARLSEGGGAVARLVGARRVAPDTADPLERRLRNVVEEMAIAAGVRVPEVYVMDAEGGINAFAAGWDVSGAVVAVTRGTLEALTRDELQGVVAHEFSHILNGDMRLNVRMIGVLAGIVFIGAVGEFVMRSVRGSRGDGKGAAGFVLAGLALFIIGYVGLFFSRLIKAAVSRQREFLADASSVQFRTRTRRHFTDRSAAARPATAARKASPQCARPSTPPAGRAHPARIRLQRDSCAAVAASPGTNFPAEQRARERLFHPWGRTSSRAWRSSAR
jgi:hypothetical protein